MQPEEKERKLRRAAELLPAVESTGVTEITFQARVDAICKGNNAPAFFRMMPEFVKLSVTEWQVIKSQAKKELGLESKDINDAYKAELAKLKRVARGGGEVIMVLDRTLPEMRKAALKAIREYNDPPQLFVRSGEIAQILIDEKQRPSIRTVREDALRGVLGHAAQWVKSTAQGDSQVFPPKEVVSDILSLSSSEWGLPPLIGVVEVPTLRSNGTVLDTPGYDPSSQLYYAPSHLQMHPVPEMPTADDVAGAVALIDDVIGDFPFAQDCPGSSDVSSSRANLIGLMLTPIVRPAIADCTPMALIDAPKMGTGKSLLVDVLSVIVSGRPAAFQTYSQSEEEMAKAIGSTLLDGAALVCFDNIEGPLRSAKLTAALTAKEYSFRLLGASKTMVVANRATWMCTGNNLNPINDMPRRCYQIRLDAKSSQPFKGREFRHKNLLEWVSEHRSSLLHALLVIARAWYANGRPMQPKSPIGSFEQWNRAIGGMLAYAGVEGFLGNIRILHEDIDEGALEWENFFDHLYEKYVSGSFTANDLIEDIQNDEDLRKALPSSSFADIDRKKPDLLCRAIGRAFSKRKETRLGADRQIWIERLPTSAHGKVARWKVCVEEKGELS